MKLLLGVFILLAVSTVANTKRMTCREKAVTRLCAVNFPDVGHFECREALKTADCYVLLCLKNYVKCNLAGIYKIFFVKILIQRE